MRENRREGELLFSLFSNDVRLVLSCKLHSPSLSFFLSLSCSIYLRQASRQAGRQASTERATLTCPVTLRRYCQIPTRRKERERKVRENETSRSFLEAGWLVASATSSSSTRIVSVVTCSTDRGSVR